MNVLCPYCFKPKDSYEIADQCAKRHEVAMIAVKSSPEVEPVLDFQI